MPTLDIDENHANYQIRAYKPGMIKVNERVFTHSIIVSPDKLIENWPPKSVHEINSESFAEILALKPDILLIGTGNKLVFLATSVYGELINHGIGVEIMDTSAACRTYNALSAENRRVTAALIIEME